MTSFQLDDRQYNELVLRIGQAAQNLQADQRLGNQITEMLQDLDLLHREALARLLATLERDTPHLLQKLLQDRVIQSIFLLYDFIPEPAEPPDETSGQGNFVPLTQLEVPHWVPAGIEDDFPEGVLTAREVNQQNLLVCRIRGELFVVPNRCLDSILPLQLGHLEGETVICPWHGCRYHLPTGRLEGKDSFLDTYPVQISSDGTVRIGFNMGGRPRE